MTKAIQKIRALPREDQDDFVDIVIRVPDEVAVDTWADLEGPMKASPDYALMIDAGADPEWSFDESELRLLVGVFGAVTTYLPMGPFEYLRWVDRWDAKLSSGQYVREFAKQKNSGAARLESEQGQEPLEASADDGQPRNSVRIVEAETGTAAEAGSIELAARVTAKDMEDGYELLGKIIQEGAYGSYQSWQEHGRTDHELKLRCGLLMSALRELPASAFDLIEFLARWDLTSHEFYQTVVYHLNKRSDDELAFDLNAILADRDLLKFGLERIEGPINRGPRPSAFAQAKNAILRVEDESELERITELATELLNKKRDKAA